MAFGTTTTEWIDDRDLVADPVPPDGLDPEEALYVDPDYSTSLIRLNRTPKTAVPTETDSPDDLLVGARFNDVLQLTPEQLTALDNHPDTDKVNPSHSNVREVIEHLASTPSNKWSEADTYAARLAVAYVTVLPREVARNSSPVSFETNLTRVDIVRLNWGLAPITASISEVMAQTED